MNADPITPLAQDFEAPDEIRWRSLAEAVLKGAPFERLATKSPDGLTIKPLYRAPDAPETAAAALIQQALAERPASLPWDIRQVCVHPASATANLAILEDLMGGVSSVALRIDDGDGQGLRLDNAESLRTALKGVLLEAAPIALDAGFGWRRAGTALAEILAGSPNALPPTFAIDPFGAWTRWGAAPQPIDKELADAAAFARDAAAQFPGGWPLLAQGCSVHEAGGGAALELAVLLASAVGQLRALDHAGLAPNAAAKLIFGRLSVGPDVVVEIAKLRAARALWTHLMTACAAPTAKLRLQAVTSRRMLARDDAWTNLLRNTAACFAAAAGGADIITVLPFTEPLGLPGPLARRMARNTQLVLMEESRLGHVADPGGGAFAVEALTHSLAEEAWTLFQRIEAQGGLAAAFKAGALQGDIAGVAKVRARLVATRRFPITGVSDFPLLEETTPESETAGPGATGPAPHADPIVPLVWSRLSEPFEALRDAAKGKDQVVFCANLGTLAEFSPRANFAMNLFAAGGVAVYNPDAVYPDHAAMAAALKASGCRVAVLTGSDARYALESQSAAKALQDAGCGWLIHAGKPANEQDARAWGFNQFIFAGQDALETLTLLPIALGIAR
jgi:methylmalonyl-CoA mutase